MQKDEKRQVEKSVGVLMEELDCIFEHVALELDLVGVHA